MSENTLVEKIKQEAAATVADIQAAGEAKVEAIKRETDAAVTALTTTKEAELAKRKAHLELVTLAKAKQAGKIAVQEAKRTQVDAVFAEVTAEILALDAAAYAAFFAKQAAAIVGKNVEVVSVEAPATRVAETEAILKEAGLTGSIVENAKLQAGLVVVAKDGVYDVTLGRLMSDVRAEVEMEITRKVMA